MRKQIYQTITSRVLDLKKLSKKEREFLNIIQHTYEKEPEWSQFSSFWTTEFERFGLAKDSYTHRICRDLEARLGIVQGTLAPPDYRDYLADRIEEQYGSRYRFCKETGIDPGHLSRVFATRSELSLAALQRVLEKLHLSLVIQNEETLAKQVSPASALQALASVA